MTVHGRALADAANRFLHTILHSRPFTRGRDPVNATGYPSQRIQGDSRIPDHFDEHLFHGSRVQKFLNPDGTKLAHQP